MDARIKYWQNIILSGKNIEAISKDEQAAYQIAEFNVSQKNIKTEVA